MLDGERSQGAVVNRHGVVVGHFLFIGRRGCGRSGRRLPEVGMSDLDARRAFRRPAPQVGQLLFQAVIEDARRLRFSGSGAARRRGRCALGIRGGPHAARCPPGEAGTPSGTEAETADARRAG